MRKKRTRTHLKPYKHKCSLLLVTVTIMTAPLSGQSLLSVPTNAAFNDIESVNFSIQADIEQNQGWDKSSLEIIEGKEGNEGNLLYAIVKNGDDSEAMQRTSTYEVYFVEKGNPKHGEKIGEGVIPMLDSGETFRMTFEADKPGKYKFRAFHSKGHPGSGVPDMWSETIEFIVPDLSEQEVEKEPDQEKPQKSSTENQKEQEPSPQQNKKPVKKEQEPDTESAQPQQEETKTEKKKSESKASPEKEQKQKAESPQSPELTPVVKIEEKAEPQPKAAQAADSKKDKKANTQENQQEQQKVRANNH